MAVAAQFNQASPRESSVAGGMFSNVFAGDQVYWRQDSIRPFVWRHRKGFGQLSRFHVPELNRCINAARQQELVVLGEDQAVHVELVAFNREEFFARDDVPNDCLNV